MDTIAILVLTVAILSCVLQLFMFLTWSDAAVLPSNITAPASPTATTFDKIFLIGHEDVQESWLVSWLNVTSFDFSIDCDFDVSGSTSSNIASSSPLPSLSIMYMISSQDCFPVQANTLEDLADIYKYFDRVAQAVDQLRQSKHCRSTDASCSVGLLLQDNEVVNRAQTTTEQQIEIQAMIDHLMQHFVGEYLDVLVVKNAENYVQSVGSDEDPIDYKEIFVYGSSLYEHCAPILYSRKYDARCLPIPSSLSMLYPLLITSLGGAGTHGIAHELQSMGYHVAHEGLALDASVSWYYTCNDAIINYSYHYPGMCFVKQFIHILLILLLLICSCMCT